MATTGSLISLEDVYRARERIGDRLHRTPLLRSGTLSDQVGADVRFKAELFQRTGSFKPRGVLNKLATLTDEEKQRGVISISAGNHAQAVAYASAAQGIDALVVMWQSASPMKIAAARGYGATIDTEAADIPTAFQRLEDLIESTGRTLVHPYDDPHVMAGQGTVGLEMLEDAPEADIILVQVGGGGLISGIATAAKGLRPEARVIAVEPERSPALHASLGGRARHRRGEVDRRRPQRPVRRRELRSGLPRSRRRVCARHRGRLEGGHSLHVRPDEARLRGRRSGNGGGFAVARVRAGARPNDRGGRLGRQRGTRNGRCYPDFR